MTALVAVKGNSRIEEIIACERRADETMAKADREASPDRWRAARLICEELDSGATQREVAEGIGKGHAHVGYMARVHKQFGHLGDQDRRSFNRCYQEVKRPGATQAKAREMCDEGLSNRIIAKKLGIDEKTVRGYLKGYLPTDTDDQPAEADEKDAESNDREDSGPTCTPLDPVAIALRHFRDDTRILLDCRGLKENADDYRAVRKAADQFMTKLAKIGRDFHHE